MNWIDCKTQMPPTDEYDESEKVLIYCDYGVLVATYHHSKTPQHCYWSEYTTTCGCCGAILNPTHWMPLPEKPTI